MAKKNKIMLGCPAWDCKANSSRLYRVKDPSVCKIPQELRKPEQQGKVLYRCSYCGFVWYQKPGHRAGLNPIVLGVYDHSSQPNQFIPHSDYRIKPENMNWDEAELEHPGENDDSSSGMQD